MSKKTPIVPIEVRDRLGKRYARRLRNTGRLPATIYSKGIDPISISVDERDLIKQLQGGNHVLELDNGDGAPATVLVKDLQFGFLGDNIIHIDFARVNLEQVVTITMTLDISGQPISASETGAVLEIPRPQIEIECMVKDIPDSIMVDLTTVEDVFRVGDLELPEGVKTILDPDRHIAHVTFVKEEVVEVEEVVEGDEEVSPEVISETEEEQTPEEPAEESDSE